MALAGDSGTVTGTDPAPDYIVPQAAPPFADAGQPAPALDANSTAMIIQQDILLLTNAANDAMNQLTSIGSLVGYTIGLGDANFQQRGAIQNILSVTIPAVQEIASRANADGSLPYFDCAKINLLFQTAINSLQEIGMWAGAGNAFVVLPELASQVASQTVKDAVKNIEAIPGALPPAPQIEGIVIAVAIIVVIFFIKEP